MMRQFTGLAGVFCLAIVGLVIAAESRCGHFANLTTSGSTSVAGGGICYTSLAADDETCPNYGGATCGDNACLRRTRESGAIYYFCDQYHIKIKEFNGYKTSVNEDQQTGRSQHLTSTFKCAKRQSCKEGENCTEVTANGVVTWKCLTDGDPTFSDEVTTHYASGSACTKPS